MCFESDILAIFSGVFVRFHPSRSTGQGVTQIHSDLPTPTNPSDTLVTMGKMSLKSLAFKHPAEDDVLDHAKDVFHQVRVRRRRRKIVKVAGWTFVLLQILPPYIRAEIERFMKNM